ncbi:heterokaryon incompatibility protein-domain-containing protein [Hypoxylon rubiginosum]|uniref:Heterokaryon incompatibility protein-domain-containing protein n=1 Tax=Hypoxylon rubiginosum TaxID=110542 RepID=A0ACC0D9W0_9PEZI|nr:heterokaryon incompatibility protein-domain-containing protein [Hypoxylon rubiginosum]
MRLLNVHTRQLEEFTGNVQDRPKYAILSHTWGKKEITFQDLSQPYHQQRPEYAKIEGCCRQAIRDNYTYVWVDTCCIDKSSSAELSEAINSMFAWYRDAAVCYVYLVDVPTGQDPFAEDSAFRKSRWFKRGWTLQELLAPSLLEFYDMEWDRLFLWEDDHSTYDILGTITGIEIQYISAHENIRSAPVALLFSWASQRSTSREEDEAYCLLGLVGVNMPLLYGEGGRAFLRLQEEIIKKSGDMSILAHGLDVRHGSS